MLTPGLGLTTATKLIEALGSAEAVVKASASELADVEGLGAKRAGTLRRAIDKTIDKRAAADEHERSAEAGAALVGYEDAGYPHLLRLIPDPPAVLWVRGRITDADRMAAAIVGARRCTLYGREQADRFGGQLAEAGLSVVSGGAYGIDKVAHDAAMAVGGRTLAVLGSGLGRAYPAPHRPMFDALARGGRGAVISEFPLDTPAAPKNFHRRNRIISGLSLVTVVIEAGNRSGALITARQCVEEHGRELMVLPGRVDSAASAGCHRILREGWATLVTAPGEAIDTAERAAAALLGDAVPFTDPNASASADARRRAPDVDPPGETLFAGVQAVLLDAMASPRSVDELAAIAGLDPGRVRSELTMLQVRGRVAVRGGLYVRRGD